MLLFIKQIPNSFKFEVFLEKPCAVIGCHGTAAQAVFDAAEAKIALQGGKAYRAACNLFALDLTANATPGVPLDEARVRRWGQTIFANGPSHLKDMVVVGVPAADYDFAGHQGSWRQVSPEELTHSLIFRLQERLEDPGTGEAELLKWKEVLLSLPVMFVVLDGEDAVYWESYEQRQRTKLKKLIVCILLFENDICLC